MTRSVVIVAMVGVLAGCTSEPMSREASAMFLQLAAGADSSRELSGAKMPPQLGAPSPPLDTLGGGGVEPDAYGPGIGMDRYGRAMPHEPFLAVEPNAYGLGVGMDQYGRPVR
ncbi:MAG: hypothetical protein ACLFU0_02840 [Alphaproteobacteria bacterium]